MHELGVVFKVIEIAEQVADENQVKEISSVTLSVGEVSGIIHDYLYDCWKWAIRKSRYLQQAQLFIETIPAVTYCEACDQTYSTIEHGKICPHCGSDHTYLKQGNEFEIKQIEVFDTGEE
ncbi:MAG: hydrogenase maturation nickel metallochaperone HypA [Paludibacteraceae bacterium]|nr:hydrogenase maturation nickel metallochaperone HypA [Paludibacteraceae bacterium]